jgi:DNA replication protein DnaC
MTTVDVPPSTSDRIAELLVLFKLPTMASQLVPRFLEAGQDEALGTLVEVMEAELGERSQRRCERLQRASKLPPGKTFATLKEQRLPRKVWQQLHELASGRFLDRAANVLCFGLPGRGKTHAAAGLGHALVQRGFSVLFTPTFRLVQELLAAKRDLALPRALQKLDAFDLLILDDIGYVQQSAEEVEVLFTLMAERYERRSLLITSNLVFGEWDRIFKNPMTTAAAIDRLIHHSVILEFGGKSVRAEEAEQSTKEPSNPATPTPPTQTTPKKR